MIKIQFMMKISKKFQILAISLPPTKKLQLDTEFLVRLSSRSHSVKQKKEVTNHMRHEGIGFLQLEYMHSFAPYSSNTNQVLGKKKQQHLCGRREKETY